MLSSNLTGLLDVVAGGSSLAQYEVALFEALSAAIGFDVGFCVRADGFGPATPGFDTALRRTLDGQLAQYGREMQHVRSAALRGGGLAVDRQVLGSSLERTRTYRDVMRPHRGHASLHVYFGGAGAPPTLLLLGRCRGGFRDGELQLLAQARSLLSVCERALSAPRASSLQAPAPRLSAVERELLTYLRLGYSNPQIAAASGKSYRTVRNQLSTLFDKLEVATRAEAVARSYELQLVG